MKEDWIKQRILVQVIFNVSYSTVLNVLKIEKVGAENDYV